MSAGDFVALVFVLIIFGLVALATLSTLAGLAPSGARLATYTPKWAVHDRFYNNSQAEVLEHIQTGVEKSPAMKVLDQSIGVVLIDARPTIRILGGGFGMIVRLTATEYSNGTVVSCDAAKKVKFAIPLSPNNALREIERVIRRNAKKEGLDEVIDRSAPIAFTSRAMDFG